MSGAEGVPAGGSAAAPAVAAAQPASALLETVARSRGLRVRRLSPDLLLCDDGVRAVTFQGLAGPASGRVAQVLCGNAAWLRWHLAGRGLPTLETRLVDLGDEDFALAAAGALGFPVVLRLAAGGQEGTAADATSFHECWRRLLDLAPDHRAQVILERCPTGPAVRVAVVGGRVTGTQPAGAAGAAGELPGAAQDLAVRAVEALPGCDYGSVQLVTDSRPGGPDVVIDTVDPSLSSWAGSPDGSGTAVAGAVLAWEMDGPGGPAAAGG